MLKDNHIDAYGSITAAVRALREKAGHMLKIEVEVRTFEELKEALDSGCEIIMLDNMSTEDMKKQLKSPPDAQSLKLPEILLLITFVKLL